MGIKGIYKEIGPGDRVALAKLAVQKFEETGRPLRIAIDISIWLFQIQAGKGGKSPALRTFYYRLLRLISCSVHPLFVFDGPNKPPFKRNKRTGPNVASIPEYLARDLLKRFGLPFHQAPGEAEAECALLQRLGIVDAVLSEDVDTLMFGSGLTFRNWSSEGRNSKKIPTHVNAYDSNKTKRGSSGLDWQGMILVALMSGGDYIPEGIPGCGPKTACEAARAGFGKELCSMSRNDKAALADWKSRLCHELQTNESKHFRQKHKALVIPDDFPRLDILKYYTHPCVSSEDQLEKVRHSIHWDQPFDIPALRQFTAEAFEWLYVGGAKKFIRNLAPALLIRTIRLFGQGDGFISDDTYEIAQREAQIVRQIFKKRNHPDTDGETELQIGFFPLDIVPIDLDAEDPDPVTASQAENDSDDDFADIDLNQVAGAQPDSPKKLRGPSVYDPMKLDKIWILESYAKVGIPLKVEDWEESFRSAKAFERQKAAAKKAAQEKRALKARGGMPRGALDRFTKVTKPAARLTSLKDLQIVDEPSLSASQSSQQAASHEKRAEALPSMQNVPKFLPASKLTVSERPDSLPSFREPPKITSPQNLARQEFVDLLSSPDPLPRPKKRILHRSHSATVSVITDRAVDEVNLTGSPVPGLVDDLVSAHTVLKLPSSVTTRRRHSPLRRSHLISDVLSPRNPNVSPSKSPSHNRIHRTPPNLPSYTSQQLFSTPSKNKTCSISFQDATSAAPRQALPAAEIIEINSSPLPIRTPQSAQRLITDWISPSQHSSASAASPSRNKILPAIASLSTIPEPPSPSPKARSKAKSRLVMPEFKDPLAPLESFGVKSKQSKVIRLRDSLQGAWAAENSAAGTKRLRGSEREWRVSQVEMLDLTKL